MSKATGDPFNCFGADDSIGSQNLTKPDIGVFFRAGYYAKVAYAQGERLLKNVEILEVITQRLQESAMSMGSKNLTFTDKY